MDILDQAIEFEHLGHKFFSESAAKAKDPAVKGILENLAADELSHAAFLRGLKASQKSEFVPSPRFHTIRNLLAESSLKDPGFLAKEQGVLDVLRKALDLEARAQQHYSDEALIAELPGSKEVLELLAAEEHRHHELIQGLIKYLDRPRTLLETQEFNWYDE